MVKVALQRTVDIDSIERVLTWPLSVDRLTIDSVRTLVADIGIGGKMRIVGNTCYVNLGRVDDEHYSRAQAALRSRVMEAERG